MCVCVCVYIWLTVGNPIIPRCTSLPAIGRTARFFDSTCHRFGRSSRQGYWRAFTTKGMLSPASGG